MFSGVGVDHRILSVGKSGSASMVWWLLSHGKERQVPLGAPKLVPGVLVCVWIPYHAVWEGGCGIFALLHQ